MPIYSVVLASGKQMRLGPFAANMSWQSPKVEAADEAAAIEQARVICRETFDPEYADGRATAIEIYTYAVTLKGRHDRRRRETFIVQATDETQAVRTLGYRPEVYRFAGGSLFYGERFKKVDGVKTRYTDDRIVSVERV